MELHNIQRKYHFVFVFVSSNIVSEDDSFRIEMSSEESEPQDDCKVSATSSMQPHGKCKKSLQKNHTCQYCGRPFPSVSLLATHTRVS